MSRTHFYLWLFTLSPVAFFFLRPVACGELAIWVALGRDSFHGLPARDAYTFTAIGEMIYPALSCLLYGWTYGIGGLELVALLHKVVPAIWVLAWYRSLPRMHGEDPWSMPVIGIFVFSLLGTSLIFVERPALLASIPLLFSYAALVNRSKTRLKSRDLAALAGLEILWANLHGSFILLPLMIAWQGFFFLYRRDWATALERFAAALAVSLAALANPFGWRMYKYVYDTASLSKSRTLDEWLPPMAFDYPFASTLFFLAALFFALGLALLWTHRRHEFWRAIFDPFTLLLLSGFLAIRNTYLVFLLLPLFLFARWAPPAARPRPKGPLNLAFAGGLALLLISLNPYWKQVWGDALPVEYREVFDGHLPKIGEFLSQRHGRIFNEWSFGGDLALTQTNPYFIDIRNIFFPDSAFHGYRRIASASPEASSLLSTADVRFIVVRRDSQPLINWLRDHGAYREVLREGPALLFERLTASDPMPKNLE